MKINIRIGNRVHKTASTDLTVCGLEGDWQGAEGHNPDVRLARLNRELCPACFGLKEQKKIEFEATVKKVGNSGMVRLPAAMVGKRVRVKIEVLAEDGQQGKP